MKRCFILSLMFVITATVFSQVSWNGKVGMNVSNLTSDGGTTAKLGIKLGVGPEYSFNYMWGLKSGVYFSQKGGKESITLEGEKTSVASNQLYLEVPVMGVLRAPLGSVNLAMGVGPYLAYGVGGNTQITSSNRSEGKHTEYKIKTFGDMGFRRFDAGIGLEFLAEFNRYIVGYDAQFGLVEVLEGYKDKNLCLTLFIGYKF